MYIIYTMYNKTTYILFLYVVPFFILHKHVPFSVYTIKYIVVVRMCARVCNMIFICLYVYCHPFEAVEPPKLYYSELLALRHTSRNIPAAHTRAHTHIHRGTHTHTHWYSYIHKHNHINKRKSLVQ